MTDSLPPAGPPAEGTSGLGAAALAAPAAPQGRLARDASILALGNITSRALGFVRASVLAALFGVGAPVDALTLALAVPNQIYELVTGGLVNSALVPVFSEYAARPRRDDLWRLLSLVLTLAAAGVTLFVSLLVLFTPQVVALFSLLGLGRNPEAAAEAVPLLRITLPAVVFLSLSGVLSGGLYALKRFTLPAFTAAVFNAGMIVVALALARWLGVRAMALGLLAGAVLQVGLQLPGLGAGLAALRPRFDLAHPGLRRIFKLYVPIIGSLLVSQAQVYIGLGLAGAFVGGLTWMGLATTLYQFPLGLVAVAVSTAILPTLSRQAAEPGGSFRTTLVQGLNLVLVLIVPAAVGLFVLARPVVALAFERGAFTAADTAQTARVLQVFLLGLAFAAVDQLLIFAYYARQDTLTPALVGVLSVAVYLLVAWLALPVWNLLALMLADSAKQITHAVVTGALLSRRVAGFRGSGLWPTLGRVLVASLAMGALAAGMLWALQSASLPPGGARPWLEAFLPGGLGLVAYFWLADRLGIGEVRLALSLVRRRLGLSRL